jgi:uncharacterized protein (TIGR00661 family)
MAAVTPVSAPWHCLARSRLAMKILVGISGLGFGHSTRQSMILPELIARGHQLALFGFDNSREYCAGRFPDIPCFEVAIPRLPGTSDGVSFAAAAEHESNRVPFWQVNFRAMEQASRCFGGPPDLVISDYCAAAAHYAYATCRPLVTIDNQSKFIGYCFPDVDGFTRQQERSRLSLYAPSAAGRLATSFFKVPWGPDPSFQVTVCPPVLRPRVRLLGAGGAAPDDGHHVVYLSPYRSTSAAFAEVMPALRHNRGERFVLFGRDLTPHLDGNVAIHRYDDDRFFDVLGGARSVICNAGSNLLCEALYLGKPILALPFATYEQRCNASVITRGGFGMATPALSADVVAAFVGGLPRFRQAIRDDLAAGEVLQCRDGLPEIMDWLQRRFDV